MNHEIIISKLKMVGKHKIKMMKEEVESLKEFSKIYSKRAIEELKSQEIQLMKMI